jgi:hypothetical protein
MSANVGVQRIHLGLQCRHLGTHIAHVVTQLDYLPTKKFVGDFTHLQACRPRKSKVTSLIGVSSRLVGRRPC